MPTNEIFGCLLLTNEIFGRRHLSLAVSPRHGSFSFAAVCGASSHSRVDEDDEAHSNNKSGSLESSLDSRILIIGCFSFSLSSNLVQNDFLYLYSLCRTCIRLNYHEKVEVGGVVIWLEKSVIRYSTPGNRNLVGTV